jgi:hypothetical protein
MMVFMETSLNAHTLGQLLDHSFRMTFRNFRRFIPAVAVYSLLATALLEYMFSSNRAFFNAIPADATQISSDIFASFNAGAYVLPILAMMLISPLFQFVVTDLAVETFFIREEEWHTGDSLGKGAGRYVPLLAANLLTFLFMLAGVFTLFVGTLVAAVFLSLIYPILVFENTAPRDTLRRSFFLIRGEFWRITAYWIVFILIFLGIDMVTSPLLSWLTKMIAGAAGGKKIASMVIRYFLDLPVAVLTIGLQSCFTVNMYFNQRIKREGFGIE